MGRGAIPSRRGFSRGAMRHPGVSGITRPFGRLSRGRGQVLHVLLSRSPLASLRGGVPFDLHVLGAPPAFILSQDRTLRPKGDVRHPPVFRREASVRPASSLIGSIRLKKASWLGNDGACPTGRPYQVILPYTFAHTSRWYDLVHLSRMEAISNRSTRGIRFSRYPRRPACRLPSRREIYCQTSNRVRP